MNYWLVKGNPANAWEKMLRPGKLWQWHSKKPSLHWKKGDRVFFWISSPKMQLVALGEFVRPNAGLDDEGQTLFDLRVQTERFEVPVGIDTLRNSPAMEGVSFLKAGPAGTVYPLTENQGEVLASIVAWDNPHLDIARIWGVQLKSEPSLFLSEGEAVAMEGFDEGKLERVVVNRYERDGRNRKACLHHHKPRCIVCGFAFSEHYRNIPDTIIHVHHLYRVADGERKPDPCKDMVPVCPNCHAALHTRNPPMTPATLRKLLKVKC
jgi:hypothetical protein